MTDQFQQNWTVEQTKIGPPFIEPAIRKNEFKHTKILFNSQVLIWGEDLVVDWCKELEQLIKRN